MQQKYFTILCVDDDIETLEFYQRELSQYPRWKAEELHLAPRDPMTLPPPAIDVRVEAARSGAHAVEFAKSQEKGSIVAAFIALRLSGAMNGVATYHALRQQISYLPCALVGTYTDQVLTMDDPVLRSSDDWVYFHKPFSESDLIQTTRHLMFVGRLRFEHELYRRRLGEIRQSVRLARSSQVHQYLCAVDSRGMARGGKIIDPSHAHARRVADVCWMLGRKLKIPEPTLSRMWYAFLLHDVGMSGSFAQRPGLLAARAKSSPAHRAHPVIGAEIVASVPGFNHLVSIIRNHHERFDGRGFPDGLAGLTIPLGARLLAVADGWDRLAQHLRKGRISVDGMCDVMEQRAGSAYDPEIVRTLLDNVSEFYSLYPSLRKALRAGIQPTIPPLYRTPTTSIVAPIA